MTLKLSTDVKTNSKPEAQARQQNCRICSRSPRLLNAMLDSQTGKAIRLCQYECGERVWCD